MSILKFFEQEIKGRKPVERGEWLILTAQQLKRSIGQIGKLTEGWDASSLKSLYLSAESLSHDSGIPFGRAWWWHYNEVKKQF